MFCCRMLSWPFNAIAKRFVSYGESKKTQDVFSFETRGSSDLEAKALP